MWSLPYLLAVAFLFAPSLLVLLVAASILEGHLLTKRERRPAERLGAADAAADAAAAAGAGPSPGADREAEAELT